MPDTFIDFYSNHSTFEKIKQKTAEKKPYSVSGLCTSSKPFIISMLAKDLTLPALCLTSDASRAEILSEGIAIFSNSGLQMQTLTSDDTEEDAELAGVAEKILKKAPVLVVSDLMSISRKVESPDSLLKNSITIKKGQQVSIELLMETLIEKGFTRKHMVEKRRDFSVRGFVFDIYPLTVQPVRIEFFGDTVESIRIFEIESQRSRQEIQAVTLFSIDKNESLSTILDYFDKSSAIILDEPAQLKLAALEREPFVSWEDISLKLANRQTISLSSWGKEEEIHINTGQIPPFNKNVGSFIEFVREHEGKKIVVFTSQASRLSEILSQENLNVDADLVNFSKSSTTIINKPLYEGFHVDDSLYVISDKELFGSPRRSTRTVKRDIPLKLEDLKNGDYIVHSTHGIGLYHGLETKTIDSIAREFLHIEYAKGDKLFLPVDQIHLIQKFAQTEESRPGLSKMGGKEWKNTKAKVKEEVEKIAAHLLELYAKREAAPGFAFSPDTPWQGEMEDSFPYSETDDQMKAIEQSKKDMETPRPMERLICGDAGYGKTEVALRCAFKAVMDGKQVAMLAPTTLLAEQHYLTFSERFAPFPVKVDLLSRFRTNAQQKNCIERLETGELDIVIGTHRMLSKDVKFKNLGLVVVDEEQHFGVIHKEKLREFSAGVDTMLLSATPIPRTLYLTMSGVRDLSVISTPPYNRRPIKTYIFPFQNDVIKGAIIREKERGGQVFFLHNRVNGIESVALNISKLVPGIRVATAHGQMSEERLENTVKDFLEGNYDVLVCTTIIQSGIDMPNVNTIIINNAYGFGLAQLYQIRGRVGRSHHQAYSYLLYPPHRTLTDTAKQRMEILKDFTELGSGFHVAMKDLELRGAGDILGKAQHGFMKSVGFDLYCQLLAEAVAELKGTPITKDIGSPVIELPVSAYIPDSYIEDQAQKLTMYRRVSAISSEDDIKNIKDEFKDRFGSLPEELFNLLDIAKIKLMLMDMLIPKLSYSKLDLFMLMPFFNGFSRSELKKMREIMVPFEVENNRMTIYGILNDEYWMEIFTEFMEKFREIMRNREG